MHIANTITIIRIPLSLCLLLDLQPAAFLALYALCGLTDVADGMVARKTKTESKTGARLDTISDLIMFGVILWKLAQGVVLNDFLPFLLFICIIRLSSFLLVLFKYKTFGTLHTYANKATGLLLFISLPLSFLTGEAVSVWIVISAALLACVEELLIHCINKQFHPDRKHLFDRGVG